MQREDHDSRVNHDGGAAVSYDSSQSHARSGHDVSRVRDFMGYNSRNVLYITHAVERVTEICL